MIKCNNAILVNNTSIQNNILIINYYLIILFVVIFFINLSQSMRALVIYFSLIYKLFFDS